MDLFADGQEMALFEKLLSFSLLSGALSNLRGTSSLPDCDGGSGGGGSGGDVDDDYDDNVAAAGDLTNWTWLRHQMETFSA